MVRTVIKITLLTRRHPEVTTGRLPLCPIMISCLKVAILYGITARPRSVFFKFFLSTVNCTGVNCVPLVSVLRAIFVWPWNENARTKQKQQTSGDRAIWLVYRTDTNAPCFWSVKRTLCWKNFVPENSLEINRYFALTSYCNTIGQSYNAFSILGFSLAGKRTGYVLIFSSITNTYWNHFSRSYEIGLYYVTPLLSFSPSGWLSLRSRLTCVS